MVSSSWVSDPVTRRHGRKVPAGGGLGSSSIGTDTFAAVELRGLLDRAGASMATA
jgi:hypothetical protein